MNNLKKHDEFLKSLTTEQAAYYLEAYNRHVNENIPLDICLGIRGAGIRSAKNRELIDQRDLLLERAIKRCTTYPGEKLWSRCGRLAKQLKNFPRSMDENFFLRELFKLQTSNPELKLKLSQNRIWEIITKRQNARRNPRLFIE